MSKTFETEEVVAPHFDIMIGEGEYKYYIGKETKTYSTYPMKKNNDNEKKTFRESDFAQYPLYCKWTEETKNKNNLTQVFFLCKDTKDRNALKENLKNGKNTKDVLPLIQNNYKSGDKEIYIGDKYKFNNIAFCHELLKNGEWCVDKVIKGNQRGVQRGASSVKDIGNIHHVTNVEVTESEGPVTLEWDIIKIFDTYDSVYLSKIDKKCWFASSTLYNNRMPDFSQYPLKGINGKYYQRIKIPFERISKEYPCMYYWCCYPSPDNVGQIHYLCGNEEDKISEVLEKQISHGSTKDMINKLNNNLDPNDIEGGMSNMSLQNENKPLIIIAVPIEKQN